MSRIESAHNLWDNPLATDGFEFVEFSSPEPQDLDTLFKRLGFRWSRRNSAWQRNLNNAGRYAAEQAVGQLFPDQEA